MIGNTDIRINTGLFDHFKIGRLQDALDYVGVVKLINLWTWTGTHRPDGILTGMTANDIEFAIKWPGEKGRFVGALLEIGWLDSSEDGTLSLHDWKEHNPWAASAQLRSDMGRMGKLASNYPSIHKKYLAAGINAISKADYDREVRAFLSGNMETTMPLSNSGDPTAPDPYPRTKDIDHDLNTPSVSLTAEQPASEPKVIGTSNAPAPVSSLVNQCLNGLNNATTSTDETIKKPISIPLNQGNLDQKPVNSSPEVATSTEVKVLLDPGEVEDVHPSQIPEGMTVEEVRSIRQEVRNEPGFETLPLFLQKAKLRTTPFAIASDRRQEQKAVLVASQNASERPQPVGDTSLSYQPSKSQTRPSSEAERAIVHEERGFAKLLHSTKELYHAFPGYRPSKNEEEWLITICQSIGNSAYTIIMEALRWVQQKKFHVQNARGFLSTWIRRVSAERGLALACA